MNDKGNDDPRELRALIDEFIQQRLVEKLDKLKHDEFEKRAEHQVQHQRGTWLSIAAKRVSQLQLASHALKGIHPDARGTSIKLQQPLIAANGLVSSLPIDTMKLDVVGNAAQLDVVKFLKLNYRGESLLERLLRHDPCTSAALSDDADEAVELADSFAGIAKAPSAPASHALAKQVYFPVGNDHYHLLAPLYPSVLVHVWHQILQVDRWSDQAKASREARRKRLPSAHGYVEYPGLAVQSFGGTKPQNISQLNSERGGKTHLMSSLPPNWSSPPVRAPMNCSSIFDHAFPGRRAVKEMTAALRQFLHEHRAADDNNISIRRTREEMVENIVGELLAYAAELHSLAPHWSLKPECSLRGTQRAWLDPESLSDDDLLDDPDLREEWPARIAKAFANWLNSTLQTKKTPFGDTEAAAWKQALLPHMEALQKELEATREEREGQEVNHAA